MQDCYFYKVKKLVVISLSLLMFSVACRDLMTYAHFYWYKDFIVKNFCIKRNATENKCQGKCYLKKSLQENQEQEQNIPNPVKEDISTIVFLSSVQHNVKTNIASTKKKQPISFLNASYCYTYLPAIFHPPQSA